MNCFSCQLPELHVLRILEAKPFGDAAQVDCFAKKTEHSDINVRATAPRDIPIGYKQSPKIVVRMCASSLVTHCEVVALLQRDNSSSLWSPCRAQPLLITGNPETAQLPICHHALPIPFPRTRVSNRTCV